jgi:hypothetical protein
MPERKPPKGKPHKKKVKKPKPKRRSQPVVQPEPGVQSEGMPVVPQPAGMPSGLPGNVGHWNHPEEEEIK